MRHVPFFCCVDEPISKSQGASTDDTGASPPSQTAMNIGKR